MGYISHKNMYSFTRLRRNRRFQWLRDLNSETSLSASDLVLPLFVSDIDVASIPVQDMPGVFKHSISNILNIIAQAISKKISAVMLFPVIDKELKTATGDEACNPDNIICKTIRNIKKNFGSSIGIISDVALDPYTDHGHDGIFNGQEILNDETIVVLVKQALIQAAAGSDIIAPSDMMDGRIKCIREALDRSNMTETAILSYASKYASNFYAPLRTLIAEKSNTQIDKRSYQLDFRNSKESLTEIQADIDEGADMIVIKPAMYYLDILGKARDKFTIPIFAYQVSGEFSMLKSLNNSTEAIYESLICIKRAGANSIITYAALEMADALS